MLFARFNAGGIPLPCYLRGFRSCRNSASMLFARFSSMRNSASMLFARFSRARNSASMLCARFSCMRNSASMLFARFSCTRNEASGVRGVLRLYHKSRVSSHGRPRRTTFVLQKPTFQAQRQCSDTLQHARSLQRVRQATQEYAKTHSGSAPTRTIPAEGARKMCENAQRERSDTHDPAEGATGH